MLSYFSYFLAKGLINYHGAVIHVGKLVDQIKRTEKNYSDLEKLHNDLLKQHNDLQKDHHKSNGKVKDLQSEVKSLTRKLNETNQDLNAVNVRVIFYFIFLEKELIFFHKF